MARGTSDRQALIVDDSPSVRQELAALLARVGFAAVEAEDGAAGLRLWRAHPGAVIFLDMEMPVLDGPSLLRVMRANGAREPVVLVTGLSDTRKVAAAIKIGATDYLAKPFDEVTVRAVLERIGIGSDAS